MELTVAICTLNGEKRLPSTLAALAAQEGLDGVAWELLLVDNNCTDGTAVLFEDFSHRHPGLTCRLVREEVPGNGAARRRAYREAGGHWICFVDDDNLLNPDYLKRGLEFGEQMPEAGAFGGGSVGEYEVPEPPYLDPFKGALAIWDGGRVNYRCDHRYFTAGLFLRTSAVREVLSEKWLVTGRSPLSLLGGEDHELYLKLTRRGWTYWYVAALSFRHVMPAGRLGLKSLLRLRFLQGGESVFLKFGYLPAATSLPAEALRFFMVEAVGKFFYRLLSFVFSTGSRRWFQLSETALRAGMVCYFPQALRDFAGRRTEVVNENAVTPSAP